MVNHLSVEEIRLLYRPLSILQQVKDSICPYGGAVDWNIQCRVNLPRYLSLLLFGGQAFFVFLYRIVTIVRFPQEITGSAMQLARDLLKPIGRWH